jgi:hypothetical protein
MACICQSAKSKASSWVSDLSPWMLILRGARIFSTRPLMRGLSRHPVLLRARYRGRRADAKNSATLIRHDQR